MHSLKLIAALWQNSIGNLEDVARLAEEAETYTAKIEHEKRRMGEMDRELKGTTEGIKERKHFIANNVSDSGLRKQVGAFQDKLDRKSVV